MGVTTCQAALALGTLLGGWRIVHTMGSKITRLNPMQGFCAETGGAITLFAATWLGIPVSTTHTITGAIIGVGAARRVSAVRWGICRQHRHRLDCHSAGHGCDFGPHLLRGQPGDVTWVALGVAWVRQSESTCPQGSGCYRLDL
jgi:hypothetical protein